MMKISSLIEFYLYSLLQYSEQNPYSEIGDEVTTTEVLVSIIKLLAVAATALPWYSSPLLE